MSLIMLAYVPFGHLQKWIAWKTASSSHIKHRMFARFRSQQYRRTKIAW
jgi:hypothetical protein